MANNFCKRIPFCFSTKQERDSASKAVSTKFPHLRTSTSKQPIHGIDFYVLHIESTGSIIYDCNIESLMQKYGGVTRCKIKEDILNS